MRAAFILLGAGKGERLGAAGTKARVPVAGRTLLEWALDPVLARADLHPVIGVLHASDIEWGHSLPGRGRFIAGGARRQDSVRLALAALPDDCERILVHDAARPLLDGSVIDRLLAALDGDDDVDGAVPVIPVDDTIRRAGPSAPKGPLQASGTADAPVKSAGLVDRAGLRRVQTPQAFRAGALRRAHLALVADGVSVTDDAAAVERLGGKILLVPGDRRLFKVTWPEDLRRLEAQLAGAQ